MGALISTEVEGFEGIDQIDATGAGDAFFGGLVASVSYLYQMPTIANYNALQNILNLNATGVGASFGHA